jgi:hypothetical protein
MGAGGFPVEDLFRLLTCRSGMGIVLSSSFRGWVVSYRGFGVELFFALFARLIISTDVNDIGSILAVLSV